MSDIAVRQITKKVVNAVVTTTVAFTASNAISNSTNPTKTSQKVQVVIGSYLIGMFVSEKLGTWSDSKVDDVFDWYNSAFNKTL